MLFRPFFLSDGCALADFHCATKRDPKHERFINRMLRTQLVDVVKDPTRDLRAFVAEDDNGALLGIATMERSRTLQQWELSVLGVSLNAKHCGIGRALLQFVVDKTPESHDKPVVFQVHENNVNMRRLLRTFDAEKITEPDARGYLVMAADPSILRMGVHLAMSRAQRNVAKRREPSGNSLEFWR